METRVAKVSSSGRRVLIDLKRKRAVPSATSLAGAAHISSPSLKFQKRRKIHGLQNKSVDPNSCYGKSVLRYYSNLKRSGSPQRLMYYENGEWTDFPQDFVASVKNKLLVRKAAAEVEIDGHTYLLDFLHMRRFDSATGLQQPIAWIDETGHCFFPETFNIDDDHRDCCCSGSVKDCGCMFSECDESNTTKLELDIVIDESECSNTEESNGESTSHVKKNEVDVNCTKISDHDVDRAFGNVLKEVNLIRNVYLSENMVKNMFMKGMSASSNAEIVEIHRGLGAKLKDRLELFMTQAEITKNSRGDANVRFAWLPSCKAEVSNIMTYGICCPAACKIKSVYGSGIHLVPANCTQTSSSYCDIDENGVKHMILCRVIMGNMEPLHRGSEQSYPSSKEYDNGVDDLKNPGCYVVWNMNTSSHIFPEYVVTFRVPSDAKGYLTGKANDINVSGSSTHPEGTRLQLELNACPPDVDNGGRQLMRTIHNHCLSSGKTPKSAWLPFSLLFSAISGKVASKEMERVMMYYEKFRKKSMGRGDFVKMLRAIVGDSLLKSALSNLQCKVTQG